MSPAPGSGGTPDPTAPARQTVQSYVVRHANQDYTWRYLRYLPADHGIVAGKTYPVIVFLHGSGEISQVNDGSDTFTALTQHGPPMLVNNSNGMCFTSAAGARECFIVLSPQIPLGFPTEFYDGEAAIDALLDSAAASLAMDRKRIYLTGLSMGGGGVAGMLRDAPGRATRYAAMAAMAPSESTTSVCAAAAGSVGLWFFHHRDDSVVSADLSSQTIDAYNGCAVRPVAAKKTIYTADPGGDPHGFAWRTPYNPDTKIDGQINLYQWFLTHQRP
jgi:predicted peptidase